MALEAATSDQVEGENPEMTVEEANFFGMGAESTPQGMDSGEPVATPAGPDTPEEPVAEDPSQGDEQAEDGSLTLFGVEENSPEPQDDDEATSQVEESEGEPEEIDKSEEDVLFVDEDGNPVDEKGNPVEVEEEPLYYVGEGMDYGNDLDKFKESHRQKEGYIHTLKTEAEAARQSLEQAETQRAEVEAEFQALRNAYFDGLSEEEHLQRIALTQLPDELRAVGDDLPSEESFVPNRDKFIQDFVNEALGGKSEDDFEDETTYKLKYKEARQRALDAYSSETEAAKAKYREALTDTIEKRTKKQAELARITERLKGERDKTKADLLEKRKQEEALAARAYEEIMDYGKTEQPLNFGDRELNSAGARRLRELDLIDENGQPSDKLVVLQANFGSQAVKTLFEGIRSQVLGTKPSKPKKKVVVVKKPRTRTGRPPVEVHKEEQIDVQKEFEEIGWG